MSELFHRDLVGCHIAELPPASVHVLRLHRPPNNVLARIGGILGHPLPTMPNRVVGDRPRVFWLAPEEWLLVDANELDGEVADAIAGVTAHLADITDGRTRFRISGAQSADLIAKGTSLDLHPRVFGEGQCARTLFAQTHVLIDRVPKSEGFDLYVDISFASHLHRWLDDANIEFAAKEN